MHFHLPKPMHGWREFAGEVGIIVVGVLIALTAEQLVETWHWHEKVASAQKNIDFEVDEQLDQTDEVLALKACAKPFVDALESAILRHDSAAIEKLHSTRPPFEPRAWRSTAWQTTMSTAVADHLNPEAVAEYEFLFSSFNDILTAQNSIVSDFAEATTGRLRAPVDATSTQLQLAAAERLRTQLALEANISEAQQLIASGGVNGWLPIQRHRRRGIDQVFARESALCKSTVSSIDHDEMGADGRT